MARRRPGIAAAVLVCCLVLSLLFWVRNRPVTAVYDGPVAATSAVEEGSVDGRRRLPTRTESSAEAFALSGEVLTEEGAPVEGVRVVYRSLAQLEAGDSEAAELVKTDAEGRFALRVAGPGYLSVVEGASPPIHEITGSRADLLFRRGESCPLEVQVVDAAGSPTPGFVFGFFYRDASLPALSMGTPSGPYETDASGRLRLTHAPCGELRFEGIGAGQAPLEVGAVDTLLEQSVTLRTLPAVEVMGTVVDAKGELVEEASLVVAWETGTVRTSVAEGRFGLQAPVEQELRFEVFTDSLGSLRQVETSPAAGKGPWELRLQMPPTRQITAFCPDDGGDCAFEQAPSCASEEPVEGLGRSGSCRPRAEGDGYDCVCPPGPVLLSSVLFEDVRVEAGVTELELRRRTSILEGMERREVSGTAVLRPDGGACEWSFAVRDGPWGRNGESGACGADGSLSMSLPVDQPLEVQVDQGERAVRIHLPAGTPPDELPPLVLAGTSSLTVTLVDPSGDFISSGFVSLEPPAEGADGVFEMRMFGSAAGAHFAELPAGTYRVLAMAMQGSEPALATVTLAEGEVQELELVGR